MTDTHQELFKRIKGSSILALPQSASKVLELAKNPENGPAEYAAPISVDLGLSAQILRFVNSSFFGFRYKITTIKSALSLVCVRTIKNFVLWNAVFSLLPNPKAGPFNLKRVFQDALRRGVFCKALASHIADLDSEELFIPGLFQDMSIPILAQCWPNEYAELLTRQEDEGVRLSFLENERFGWNHAMAGAYLAEEWGFGNEFAKSIENHIRPVFDHDGSKTGLSDALVALSSLLPSAADSEWKEAEEFFNAYYRVIKKAQPVAKAIPQPPQLFAEVDFQYNDLLTVTATPAPTLTLVEYQKKYTESME